MKTRENTKRITAWLIACVMLIAMAPFTVSAADGEWKLKSDVIINAGTYKAVFESSGNENYTLEGGTNHEKEFEIILTIGQKEAVVFGKTKTNDVAPIIRNDRTMLPARFVAEELGAKVSWNEAERKVTIKKNDIEIILTIDSDIALVNGEEIKLDSPAFIENDRTYTSVRFIAENLGASVDWNEGSRKVIITK